MPNPQQHRIARQQTTDNAVRVQDCRVWAEIHYLDSPTDYHEYLPQSSIPSSPPECAALTMLDNYQCCFKKDPSKALLLLLAIVSLAISAYLLYRVLDLL